MSWHTIKRDKADILFSDYIRRKASYRCQKCNTLCRYGNDWVMRMDASHYWSRSHESVRFDSRNVYALCSECHKRMGGRTREENGEYDLWVKEMLGQQGFDRLKVDANTYCKKDRFMRLLEIKELIKELDK